MGGLSIWHWLIVLLIVALVFGTKKLRNIGSDLGGAVKGFKDGMQSGRAIRLWTWKPKTRLHSTDFDSVMASRAVTHGVQLAP